MVSLEGLGWEPRLAETVAQIGAQFLGSYRVVQEQWGLSGVLDGQAVGLILVLDARFALTELKNKTFDQELN